MDRTCGRCGGALEEGYLFPITHGLVGPPQQNPWKDVAFVVPGQRTSANPITAFKQGMSGAAEDRFYRVRGLRCVGCGALELYATPE
jgi:hypothetical protein